MTPMIPKISVSPLATRNSSKPYCTAFKHWTRKVARSTETQRKRARRSQRPIKPRPRIRLCRSDGWRPSGAGAQRLGGVDRSYLAAARRVGQALDRHRLELVVVSLGFAQVHVLHRVAGRRDRELAARAVDDDLA